jgi:uncharacterized protein (DUF58 family)
VFAAARQQLRQRISDWIFPAKRPESAPVVLVQRRIFILPTRTGYFFAFVLGLLLIASINYSLQLGFMLTFLLAGMGSIGMFHTWSNLARLTVSPGKVEAVHAGETALFSLVFSNPSVARFSIGLKRAGFGGGAPVYGDVGEQSHVIIDLPVLAEKRGVLRCGRLEIFTEYPLGLFHAWSYVDFGLSALVYPKPDAGAGALPFDMHTVGEGNMPIKGDEEFQSLRAYKPGDTPRQIAWKALAREQGLLVKEFGATASADLWLDFDALNDLPTEHRLQRLTWWILEANRQQVPYGLKLPGHSFPPMMGTIHRDRCLEALALFGLGDAP